MARIDALEGRPDPMNQRGNQWSDRSGTLRHHFFLERPTIELNGLTPFTPNFSRQETVFPKILSTVAVTHDQMPSYPPRPEKKDDLYKGRR